MYDLNIMLEEGKAPFYQQIYEYLKKEIAGGNIPPATRLPSTRRLAENLSVSRSTTQAAYDQLVAEGYLKARQGSGYYAADLEWMREVGEETERETEPKAGETAGTEAGKEAWRNAGGEARRGSGEDESFRIDFSPRGVDSAHVPVRSWRSLTRKVLNETGGDFF